MSPSSFNDIVPPERRSIRNISPSHARARGSRPYEGEPPEESADAPQRPPRRPRGGRRRLGIFLLLVAVLALATAGFSFLLSGSKIVVVPKQKEVVIEGTFEALRDGEGSAALSYQLMTHTKSVSENVEAEGEEEVHEPASGTIVIYNDFSSAEQRLVKNTRFESPKGLIYRVADSVTVPGQRTEGGKTVPGSVEAVVYADKPGEEYNSEPTDFTIPGFKGDPRYEKFYARSKTPLAGGFDGMRPAVDEATLTKATDELKAKATEELKKEAAAQKPEGYHLFDDLTFIAFDPISTASEDGKVTLTQNATLYGVLVSDENLARFIAAQTVAGYDDEPVRVEDPTTISLALAGEEAEPWKAEKLSITANGTAHLIWAFSEEGLKEDLTGREKAALPTILSGYPSIEKAEVVLRPFWRQSFPENPDEITVEIVLTE